MLAEGHAERDRRRVANEKFRGYIEGIVYKLHTDCRWEDCPGFREHPDTIRVRYNVWKENVWPKIGDIIDPEGRLNLPREDRKRPASASDTDEQVPSAKRPRKHGQGGTSPVQLLDGPSGRDLAAATALVAFALRRSTPLVRTRPNGSTPSFPTTGKRIVDIPRPGGMPTGLARGLASRYRLSTSAQSVSLIKLSLQGLRRPPPQVFSILPPFASSWQMSLTFVSRSM